MASLFTPLGSLVHARFHSHLIKIILTLFFAVIASSCVAEDMRLVAGPDTRTVAGKPVDFRAANAWVRDSFQNFYDTYHGNYHGKTEQQQEDRGWQLYHDAPKYAPIELLNDRVFQVLDDSVLLGTGEKVVFVAHCPTKDLVDGTRVFLVALPSGTYRYTDVFGAKHTVKAYDFGTPTKPVRP
jgi:hypothetical protein